MSTIAALNFKIYRHAMYAFVKANNDFHLVTACLICTLADLGVNIDAKPKVKKCHISRASDHQYLKFSDSRQSFPTLIPASEILVYHKYYLCQDKIKVVETECDVVCHEGVWHAVGASKCRKSHVMDMDFLTMLRQQHAVDIGSYYQPLMRHAIWRQDHDMTQYLILEYPDKKLTRNLEFVNAHYDKRHEILSFMSQHGIVRPVRALCLALCLRSDYLKYLAFDLAAASDSEHHKILKALNFSHVPKKHKIWHELQKHGLRIQAETLTNCNHFNNMHILRDMMVRELPETILQANFQNTFMAKSHRDWSWLNIDFARNCLLGIIARCHRHYQAKFFRRFLEIFYAEASNAEYEALFLETFDWNEHVAKVLLNKMESTLDLVAKSQAKFQYHAEAIEFSADYLDFLTQNLSIEIDTEWYVMNLADGKISVEYVVTAMRRRPELDWNRRYPTISIPEAHMHYNCVSHITLLEIMFCASSTWLDVAKLANDMNMVLDVDNLREYYLAQHTSSDNTRYHCQHHHLECFYRNFAEYSRNYAFVKCLHAITPDDSRIMEIWNWIRDIFVEKIGPKAESVHADYYHPYCLRPNPKSKSNHRHWTKKIILLDLD